MLKRFIIFIIVAIMIIGYSKLGYARPLNHDNRLDFDINAEILRAKYGPTLIFEEGIVVENGDAKLKAGILGEKMSVSLHIPEIKGLIKDTELINMDIDALGKDRYPIPGLHYGAIGVNLVIQTYINATITYRYFGMDQTQQIEWHKTGNRTFTVQSGITDKSGDCIDFSISNIKYILKFSFETGLGVSIFTVGLFDIIEKELSFVSTSQSVTGELEVVSWWEHHWQRFTLVAGGITAIFIIYHVLDWYQNRQRQ